MLLAIYKITTFLIPVAAFGVGFYSLYLNPKSKLIWLWFLTSLAVGFWGVGLLGILLAKSYGQAMVFDRFLHASSAFIPAFYLHFILTFLHQNRKKVIFFTVPAYIISLVFSIMAWVPNIFVLGASSLAGFNYWVTGGPLYWPFVIYFYVFVLMAIIFLFASYVKSDGIIKKQIGYVIVASLIGFIGGGTSFLPQTLNIYPFGTFFTFLYPLLITYGIFLK